MMIIRKALILGLCLWCFVQLGEGSQKSDIDSNDDLLSALASLITPGTISSRIGENIKSELGANNAVKDFSDKHRKLQGAAPLRKCGEVIGTINTDEMRSVAEVLIGVIIPDQPSLVPIAVALLGDFLKNNVTVTKECSSCAEVAQGFTGQSFLSDAEGFLRYCASNSYGYDARHSWLQFNPVDTENIVLQGTLRGYMVYHGLVFSVADAPTEAWPVSVSTLVDAVASGNIASVAFLFDYVTAPLAASSGALAMVPDYIGFGESYNFNRSFLTLDTYMQASAVSFLGAQLGVSSSTGGCTMMDSAVTLTGVSEGGYAVVAAGYALNRLGVRILSEFTIAAPLNIEIQNAHSIGSIDQGLIDFSKSNAAILAALPLFGFAYSNNYEFLANSNSQSVLSPAWTNPNDSMMNVFSWFEIGALFTINDVISMVPQDATQVILSDLVSQIRAAISNNLPMCDPQFVVAGVTDLICQAIQDNNAVTMLETVDYDVVYCYSQDDTLVPFSQRPQVNNPFVQEYTPSPLIPFLAPMGDHQEALLLCSLGPVLFFSSPPDAADAPNLIVPLASDAVCLGPNAAPTAVPTVAPTASPTTSPTTAPTATPTSDPNATPQPSPFPTPFPTSSPTFTKGSRKKRLKMRLRRRFFKRLIAKGRISRGQVRQMGVKKMPMG